MFSRFIRQASALRLEGRGPPLERRSSFNHFKIHLKKHAHMDREIETKLQMDSGIVNKNYAWTAG